MAVLRYVAEAVRIRLLALRYTAARRGFLATRMALRIGAAQFKFNHSPLLNGRENFKFNRTQRMGSRLVVV